jgi:Zn-dependent protease with chaperone function
VQAVQKYTLPSDILVKAIHFAHARHVLYFAGFAFSLLVLIAIIRLRLGAKLARLRSPAYFIAVLAIVAIASIPIDIAYHAVSLDFGISIQSWPSWLWDWTKGQIVFTAIGVSLLWPFYVLLKRSPRRWWLWAWLASLPLLVAGAFADPLVFEPLFNRFTPLSKAHPELAGSIEQLLHRAGVAIPQDRLFEMSASEKTNSLNAYVSGFGSSRRLVLYDTIIRKEEGAPLMTTVGHELGHYVLNHIPEGLTFTAVLLFIGFFLADKAAAAIVRKWGPALAIASIASRESLPLLLLIALLLSFISEPIANAFSRRVEHQADVYSLELTHGVVPDASQAAARAFQIEGETDLDEPDPNRFIVWWLYSHPPTSDRLEFALTYDPWSAGRRPSFVR